MKENLAIILTSCNKEEDARNLVDTMLQERIAACVNLVETRSSYIWQGKIEKEDEKILIIKTLSSKSDQVIKRIKEIHPYEVPEIVVLHPSQVDDNYLNWVRDSIKN